MTNPSQKIKGMPRAFVSFVVAAAVLAAGADAEAIGLGNLRSTTLLGRPLNVAIPIRLEDDEALEVECVSAEVHAGEERVDPSAVRPRLTRGGDGNDRTLRITTTVPITEPVVTVSLSVGCPPRLSRKFVAFADPPEFRSAQAEPAPPVAAAPVAQTPRTGDVDTLQRAEPTPAAPAASRRVVRRDDVDRAPRQSVASVPKPPKAQAPAPARPRLRLDVVEPMAKPAPTQVSAAETAAARAADEQASAARAAAAAAQAAASQAEQRMLALESELARLRAQTQADRDALVALRARTTAPAAGTGYLPWLIGLLAVLVLLALALGWRLLQLSRAPRPERWQGQSEMSDLAESSVGTPPAAAVIAAAAGQASAPAPMGETRPQVLAAAPPRPREVTVEEQIDLEQQADFFIALGQDEAAVDLLLTHLRGTGGTNPMPYLKLLEIHRRRNDREGYERMRVRFNQRFNGIAPEWGADPAAGRTLEDHPDVLARVQKLWRHPLDAMADLESMLFRKGEGAELFDLPAYLDVLFLYEIARDLHQQERQAAESPGEPVDVLLPIGDAAFGDPLAARRVELDSTSVLHGTRDEQTEQIEQIALDLDLDGHAEGRERA